jgi:hydrogenase maturation protein HypF
MLKGNINCPLSSGAGRFFDAVSAMLGLCEVEKFDSEAPMRLEAAITTRTDDHYPRDNGNPVLFDKTFRAVLEDISLKPVSLISAKFHNTIAMIILDMAENIRKEHKLGKVILSGGVFQNKYLLEKSSYLLARNGFSVFTNNLVPANDGGISLGQLVIALKKRE